MKPTLAYLFTAGNTLQDAVTRKFSFIDVFSLISISSRLGYTIQSFYVAGRINNVPAGTAKTVVTIEDENKNIISTATLTGGLVKGDLPFAAAFNFLKFEKPGRYYLRVNFDDKRLADGNKFYIDVILQNE